MLNSSIWPIDKTLSGTIIPGQNGPGSDGNEGTLYIPQISSITGASWSDCLVSYPGHSLERSYSSAEIQSVYSMAPAKWAGILMIIGVIVTFIFQYFVFPRVKVFKYKTF